MYTCQIHFRILSTWSCIDERRLVHGDRLLFPRILPLTSSSMNFHPMFCQKIVWNSSVDADSYTCRLRLLVSSRDVGVVSSPWTHTWRSLFSRYWLACPRHLRTPRPRGDVVNVVLKSEDVIIIADVRDIYVVDIPQESNHSIPPARHLVPKL